MATGKEEGPDIVTYDLRILTTMTVGIFGDFCWNVARSNWLNIVLKVTNSDEIDLLKSKCQSSPLWSSWLRGGVQETTLRLRSTDDGQLCCSKKYAISQDNLWNCLIVQPFVAFFSLLYRKLVLPFCVFCQEQIWNRKAHCLYRSNFNYVWSSPCYFCTQIIIEFWIDYSHFFSNLKITLIRAKNVSVCDWKRKKNFKEKVTSIKSKSALETIKSDLPSKRHDILRSYSL